MAAAKRVKPKDVKAPVKKERTPAQKKADAAKRKAARLQKEYERKVDLGKKICAQYAQGEHSLESCCESYGVPVRTFYSWVTDWESKGYEEAPNTFIAEVAGLYKKAQADQHAFKEEKLKKLTMTALEMRLSTYEYEEEHTELEAVEVDGVKVLKPVKVKRVKKKALPQPGVVIFAAKNLMPERFSETYVHKTEGDVTHTHKLQTDKPINEMTDAELDEVNSRYQKIIEEAEAESKKSKTKN